MGLYKVTMRVDITRVVEAESETGALENVDSADMMHELKHYGVDEEYFAERMDE
ncbi:hypothetical protein [Bacillus cereus]